MLRLSCQDSILYGCVTSLEKNLTHGNLIIVCCDGQITK